MLLNKLDADTLITSIPKTGTSLRGQLGTEAPGSIESCFTHSNPSGIAFGGMGVHVWIPVPVIVEDLRGFLYVRNHQVHPLEKETVRVELAGCRQPENHT
jgi:hypothetical protein